MTPRKEEYRNSSHNSLFNLPMEEIRALYEGGLSLIDLGKRFGVHAMTIHKHMRLHGIPRRKPGKNKGQWGPEHHSWKGSNAHYTSLHERLTRRLGRPQKCENCGTTDPSRTYEWANLTGNYADMEDYKRMCRSCHKKYDHNRRKNGDKRHGGATKPLPPYLPNPGIAGGQQQ